MNRLALSLTTAVAALAIASAPVAQASIVTDFKAALSKNIGTKKNAPAAKAAVKTIAKFVMAAPKGDPKKFGVFSKLATKALNGLLDQKSIVKYAQSWALKAAYAYFKKGKVKYSPTDAQFKKSLSKVYGLLKNGSQEDVDKSFTKLKVLNKKLKGGDAGLGVLQEEVAKITGVTPVS